MNLNQKFLTELKSMECPDATYHPDQSALVFDKGQGSYIYDVEGRRYIDFCSGFGVMSLGHNPEYARRVLSEPDVLLHGMGDVYPSSAKVSLLKEILSLLPDDLNRGAFAVTGSQAVEYALKTAMLFTGGSGIIAIEGGYHGLDFGALSVTSREDFRAPFTKWLNEDQIEFIPPEADESRITQAFSKLESKGHVVAAVLAEPIQGRAGVRVLSMEFMNSLRSLTQKKDALLIFDEIFCGYWRTGPFSYSECVPCDITCLGKPMGGGLPLSGFFAREDVMRAWPDSKGEAMHTGTFFGHALACKFGIEVLKAYREIHVKDQIIKMEEFIKSTTASLPSLKGASLSGKGLMLAFNTDIPGFGIEWMNLCREQGLIVLASGAKAEGVSLTPAFNIPAADVLAGLKILDETFSLISAR